MNLDDLGISEHELIGFFGSDHVSRAYGTEWFDSDSVYQVIDKNGISLSCAVHPIHRDVHLSLTFDGRIIFDWHAQDLADIRYVDEKDKTSLQFIVTGRDILTLRVVPFITLHRSTGPLP